MYVLHQTQDVMSKAAKELELVLLNPCKEGKLQTIQPELVEKKGVNANAVDKCRDYRCRGSYTYGWMPLHYSSTY